MLSSYSYLNNLKLLQCCWNCVVSRNNLRNSQQPVHFSSKTFTQAAQIAEKIESLEKQLSVILQGGDSIAEKQSTPKVAPKREKESLCQKRPTLQLLTVPKTEEERYDQRWSRS